MQQSHLASCHSKAGYPRFRWHGVQQETLDWGILWCHQWKTPYGVSDTSLHRGQVIRHQSNFTAFSHAAIQVIVHFIFLVTKHCRHTFLSLHPQDSVDWMWLVECILYKDGQCEISLWLFKFWRDTVQSNIGLFYFWAICVYHYYTTDLSQYCSKFLEMVHSDSWTDWLSVCRRHFQLPFLEWKRLHFNSNFHKVSYWEYNWQQVTIDSSKSLVPNGR